MKNLFYLSLCNQVLMPALIWHDTRGRCINSQFLHLTVSTIYKLLVAVNITLCLALKLLISIFGASEQLTTQKLQNSLLLKFIMDRKIILIGKILIVSQNLNANNVEFCQSKLTAVVTNLHSYQELPQGRSNIQRHPGSKVATTGLLKL